MRALYILFLMLFCINITAYAQVTRIETMPHGGIERGYRVHLPPNYSPESVLPCVLNFHGLGSNAFEQEIYSQFNNVADTAHIIVVYPDGVNNLWNVAFAGITDDIGFTSDLIDTLHARYNIDLESVFSTGMSNGGFMSYKLACELTDRFQAIASVTGSIVPGQLAVCNPSNQIPVMQIHGTLDGTVPYEGGNFAIPIEEVVDFWVGHDNCEPANVVAVSDIDMMDGTTAERFEYLSCDGDNEVVFYRIEGGGHTWPGASILLSGNTCQDFNASDEIWKFFYPYRSSNVVVSNEDIVASRNIVITPNPFKDFITVNLPSQDLRSLQILDLNGRVVRSISGGDTVTIDMQDYAKGIYFVQAIYEDTIVVRKVVKQ